MGVLEGDGVVVGENISIDILHPKVISIIIPSRRAYFFTIYLLSKPPNGLAHLPPIIAKQLTLKITFSTKWPPPTDAGGGQVEPVLAHTPLAKRN
jgi:hypothetical protein